MSHFPWIYLKHTQEAIGPPPTSGESGGSWIGKRKGDLATVLLRSELGQEMMWRRRLRKALSRTPSTGRKGIPVKYLDELSWVSVSFQSEYQGTLALTVRSERRRKSG